ncbi:MAG TPA: ubiquitin-like domain-containing protein [Candidatus Acidoferrum sp.]|nr:ubiquitin-like domain-containing protein [Candidatus Acidoferrum sp.]
MKTLAAAAAPVPAKHVTFIRDGISQTLETEAATAGDLLAAQGVVRAPEDALSVAPDSPLADGETIVYRTALPVTVVVDNQPREVHTAATTVADLLAQQNVVWDRHDRISPAPATPIAKDAVVRVQHMNTWTEAVRTPIAPRTVKRWAFALPAGKSKIVNPGKPGVFETSYLFFRSPDRRSVHRQTLAARVLRTPRPRILAEGIGEYTAISRFAARGVEGTLRFASAALSMVATAYTASCIGCSGTTASGRPAGHGVVAVDPRVIPLGTHMFIPGYGRAVAGDTGGAIHGNRIDLGFNSNRQANQFGRRPVTVYLLK